MVGREFLDIASVNQQVQDIQNGTTSTSHTGEGIVLLKNFSKGTTSSEKPKYSGIIANEAETYFSVWSNSPAFNFFETTPLVAGESVVKVKYDISKYGFIVNSLELVDGYDPDDFIYHKYSIPEKSKEFNAAIKASGATSVAISLMRTILHMGCNDNVSSRIAREYAALSHHDNCPTGLLAHITKCLQLYNGIKPMYPFLNDERTNDLIVIGIAIHDIGKIFEMHNGTYQEFSFITHRGLGIEYILQYKQDIVDAYDEEFYYMLLSIIQQHHDEYGESAKTLYAYLVHHIDDLDAKLTSINELMEDDSKKTSDTAGTKIKYSDRYLHILKE